MPGFDSDAQLPCGILSPMSELDLEGMRHALGTARRLGFRHVSIRQGDHALTAVLSDPEAESEEWFEDEGGEPMVAAGPVEKDMTAPCVGYVRYRGEALTAGSQVEKGQVFGEIVALGLANDLAANATGEVVEVLVAENDPVEFGQTILRIRESS